MAHAKVKVHYAEDLAHEVCSYSACDGVALRQPCHPWAGVFVEYERSTQLLCFNCRECGAPFSPVAVARDPQRGN